MQFCLLAVGLEVGAFLLHPLNTRSLNTNISVKCKFLDLQIFVMKSKGIENCESGGGVGWVGDKRTS